MIPILYRGTEQQFLHNGLGRLADAITCQVTEERNGTFELEMTYPITGVHYADIAENEIILAKTEDGGNNQAFMIYKISRPLNGIVTINAQHISYLLNGFIVMPFSAVSCQDAFSKIAPNIVLNTPFTFATNVSSIKAFTLDAPRSVRNLLGGSEGSILDNYGGYDYKFDNFNVYLYENRGQDNGVSIRYGKNLTALKTVDDMTNVYTGIVPYWADAEGNTLYLTEKVVYSSHADDYPYKIIKTVDFSSEFENQPTESQLRQKAQDYLTNNAGWKLKNNIDVSFISLYQTEEYKDIAPLERVKLCDIVTVVYSKLGVNVKTKVIKTVYDVLNERYTSISLGDTTYTLAKAITEAMQVPTTADVTQSVKTAVDHATNLIRGGLGGHVVMNVNGDGEPQEILIMDTDDIATAVDVIRMNLGGIGFSHNGYNGPYTTAWTIDGHFVADFIDTGNLNGGLISANTIQASALSLDAREALGTLVSYLPDNLFADLSQWSWRVVADGTVSIATIDGENCLALDGTSLSAFSTAFYAETEIPKLFGAQTVTVKFKQRFSADVSISQRNYFVYYYDSISKTYRTAWVNSTGTYAANQWYDYSFTWVIDDPSDPSVYIPRFGIYHVPNAIRYIKDLSVTTQIDNYTAASMMFTQQGLELVAEDVKALDTHNYLPFDIFDNSQRWKQEIDSYSGSFAWGLRTITIPTGQIKTMWFVGVNSGVGGAVYLALKTDYAGQVQISYSFKVRYSQAITLSEDINILAIRYVDRSTGNSAIYAIKTLASGSSYAADTEYSYTGTFTPAYVLDPNTHYAEFIFQFVNTVDYDLYDVSITGTNETYKKATLSYTADGLDSVVQSGDIISKINQSAESVSIQANKINLTGQLSLHGDFTSYDDNDNTTYAFLDEGSLKFFNQGSNIFTVSSLPLLGSNAGIFFGDAEDPQTLLAYSYMTQEFMQTPTLLVRKDGSAVTPTGAGQALIEGDFSVYGSSIFYGNVYNSGGGVVFVSDKNKKRNIKDLVIEKAKSFIMALKPREFKFIKEVSTSNRKHHGFIAQEIHDVMYEDWGLYCEDKKADNIGLRYDELIADMVAVIQDQEKRIEALERIVHDKSNIQS